MSLRSAVVLATVLMSACQRSGEVPVGETPLAGSPTIEEAWAPATPPSATVAAAYMKILARQKDVLVAAHTAVAMKVEMHATTEDGGMMKMRPLQNVELAPDQLFAFEPGGAHFMLIGLHAPLEPGSRFPMTLRFQNAGEIAVEVSVTPLAPTPAANSAPH